jgi:hypothetical protein
LLVIPSSQCRGGILLHLSPEVDPVASNSEVVLVKISSSMKMNKAEKEKYIENFDYPHCDEVGKYEKLSKIGQGTFG